MEITAIIAIFCAVLLMGIISGIQMAFVSASKLSIELQKKQGTYSGKIWGKMAANPTKFISALLILFNIVFVIYALMVSDFTGSLRTMLLDQFPALASDNLIYFKLFVDTVIAIILLLAVQVLFNAYFRARSSSVMSNGLVGFITNTIYTFFSGIAQLFLSAAEWILKYIFNVNMKQKQEMYSKTDLEKYVQQNKNYNNSDSNDINQQLFENALTLSDTKLRECLVPRKEIVSIDKNAGIDALKEKFISSSLSKLVVYENNTDTIVGYVHQLDLFKDPKSIDEILLSIPLVPESMTATALMDKLSQERKSIAWVVDEYGGTAGIVTMEDLLEEIFGDIRDEFDTVDEFVDKQLSENEFLLSGRLKLDHIEDKYELQFEDNEDSETLSGYVIHQHEQIPKEKASIIIGNYQFDIISVSDTRIETLKLKVLI